MLQRGGVEDQLGADVLEQAADAWLVADIGQHRLALHVRMPFPQLQVDLVEHVFAVIEQRQAGRAECGHLPRQLAPDGTAGAGDQHAPPLDQPGHPFAVQRDLRAVQQLLDLDPAERDRGFRLGAFAGAAAGGGKGGQARQALHRHAVAVAGIEQALQLRPLQLRGSQHHQRRQPPFVAQQVEHAIRFLGRAEHAHAMDAPAHLAFAQAQYAHHAIGDATFPAQRAQEQVGPVTSANHQHALRRGVGQRPGAARMPQPRHDAGQGEQRGQQQRVDGGEGEVGWPPGIRPMQHRPEQRRRPHRRGRGRQQVRQGGEAPILPGQAERPARQQQRHHPDRQAQQPPQPRRPGAGRGQPERAGHGQGRHRRIDPLVQKDPVPCRRCHRASPLPVAGRGRKAAIMR